MSKLETPLSIVITTYNRRKELKRCLRSIKIQNYTNYEVIIVDDYSKPSYKEEIIREFPYVKYLYQSNNTGPGQARNNGINKAVNNYVVIMDDDDIFHFNALKKINEFLISHSHIGESYPVYNFLCSNAFTKYNNYYRVYSFSEMICNAFTGDLVHIINKKFFCQVEKFSYPDSKIGSELLLWYKIAIKNGFPIINECIVDVMEDATNRLTNTSRQIKYSYEFAEYQIAIIKEFKEEILQVDNKVFLREKYIGAITYLLLSGQKKKAIQFWISNLNCLGKYLLIFPIFCLPKKVIIKLFYFYRNIHKVRGVELESSSYYS